MYSLYVNDLFLLASQSEKPRLGGVIFHHSILFLYKLCLGFNSFIDLQPGIVVLHCSINNPYQGILGTQG